VNITSCLTHTTCLNFKHPKGANSEGAGKDLEEMPSNSTIPGGDTGAIAMDKEVVTKSGRVSKPPARFDDYVPIEAVFSIELDCYELDNNPIVFAASTDPDVLHYHEAMKQPDRVQFI
jgi:hypothetical protein